MARTRKTVSKQNLHKIPVLIQDTGVESSYFNIKQLNSVFSGGRNGFLITGTQLLQPNTEILIEILDNNGNSIYVEAIKNFVEAGSRLIASEIYEDTPSGTAMLTIVGTAKITPDGRALPTDKHNVRWQKKIIIEPRNRNITPIRVKRQPELFVEELLTTESLLRRTEYNIGANFKLIPKSIHNRQSGYLIQSNMSTPFASYQTLPTITGSLFLETRNYTIDTSIPTSSYVVVSQQSALVDLPLDLFSSTSSFTDTNITSSIDYSILNVSPLMSGTYEITSSTHYTTPTQFTRTVTLITSSVKYNYISESIYQTSESLSLAKLRIVNLDTVSGEIYRVKTSNKSAASQLEYEFVADSQTLVGEILVTSSLIVNEKETSIGIFNSPSILTGSWYAYITGSSAYSTASASFPLHLSDINMIDGAYAETPSGSYFFGTRALYYLFPNSEYTLKFDSVVHASTTATVDVYLVGTAIVSRDPLGQKLGTITTDKSVAYFPETTFNFTVPLSGSAGLRFVVSQGSWEFANVSIKVSEEHSFSPDEVTLLIPNNFKYNDLLSYKTDFYDINNNAIGISAISEPTPFTGARRYVLRTGDTMSGRLRANGGISVTGSLDIQGGWTGHGVGSGSEMTRWGNKLFNYLQAYDIETQSGSANVENILRFRQVEYIRGFESNPLLTGSATVQQSGLYNFQFSLQLTNTTNSDCTFDFWFKVNGTNIDNTNTKFNLYKVSGQTSRGVAAWNFMEWLDSGSSIQLAWSNDTGTGQILYIPTGSSPARPAAPSSIVTITQIA